MGNEEIDRAERALLQALRVHGRLLVSDRLAKAIRERNAEVGHPELKLAADHISAVELVGLSNALRVSLAWFVEADPTLFEAFDPAGTEQTMDVASAFATMDHDTRKKILALAEYFAQGATGVSSADD